MKYSRGRPKALRQAARHLGLTVEGSDWSSSTRVPQLESPLFQKGDKKKFANIMSGVMDGLTANFFDYSYRGGRTRMLQTVAAFTQDAWMPTFELIPLGSGTHASAGARARGIRFDFAPGFSNQFLLRGPDEEKIRNSFTLNQVLFLERLGAMSEWRFEASEFTLIVYRRGETVSPAHFPAFVRETTALAKAFWGIDR